MSEAKQRHGCLTAWLILTIAANALSAFTYLLGSGAIAQAFPNAPGWIFMLLGLFAVFNVVCAVALFQWKKWGFWGFCLSSVVAFVVNLSVGLGIATVLFGFVGVALLYAVLQIGNENKGWPQLE
jgi:hypothetical protein